MKLLPMLSAIVMIYSVLLTPSFAEMGEDEDGFERKPVAKGVPITYTETIWNATAYPYVKIGLGSQVFSGSNVSLTLTFVGNTKNVYKYQVTGASGHVTTGYRIDKGKATVQINDQSNQVVATATFAPGEVYVGTDITNRGLGFGSRIYPIYPYALLAPAPVDLSLPTYDLAHDAQVNYYAISCVGFAVGTCKNFSPNAPDFPLHTNKGDFWVTGQGITFSSFSAVTMQQVPKQCAWCRHPERHHFEF